MPEPNYSEVGDQLAKATDAARGLLSHAVQFSGALCLRWDRTKQTAKAITAFLNEHVRPLQGRADELAGEMLRSTFNPVDIAILRHRERAHMGPVLFPEWDYQAEQYALRPTATSCHDCAYRVAREIEDILSMMLLCESKTDAATLTAYRNRLMLFLNETARGEWEAGLEIEHAGASIELGLSLCPPADGQGQEVVDSAVGRTPLSRREQLVLRVERVAASSGSAASRSASRIKETCG